MPETFSHFAWIKLREGGRRQKASELGANWEPQTLLKEWDYSEETRREFIKYSNLSAEEVERLWLDDLVNKHREKWDEFRNWELGQCAKLYSEVKPSRFMYQPE